MSVPYGSGPYGAGVYPGDSSVLVGRHPSSYVTLPRIWRSDIYQTRLESLAPARAVRATFSYNEDYATKRKATVEVINPDALTALGDWILAEVEIVDDTGTVAVIPLGHYLVIEPDITMDNHGRRGTVDCQDLTWYLQQATIAEQYVVPAGTDHGAAARTIALQQGIPSELINIPDSGTVTDVDIVSQDGDNWLSIMTTVLAGGTMYQPWIARDNRLTSRKVRDVQGAAADASYRSEDGAKIVPPVQQKPEVSRVRNQVTVRKAVPGEPLISWTATVEDPGSRAHPNRIGELMGTTRPVIFGITYDESAITSEADAKLLAESRLSENASFLDRLTIETYLDHTLDGHQILDLDLMDGDDHYYTGNWLQRTWTVTVDGPKATVKRELTRTISWR